MSNDQTQSLIAVGGVVVGLLVGLGAPWLTATLSGRASRGREQHLVADRILDLWQHPESIRDIMLEDRYGTRRSLLLLANRLRSKSARSTALRFVHSSVQASISEDALIDAWTEVVSEVAKVYRRTGG